MHYDEIAFYRAQTHTYSVTIDLSFFRNIPLHLYEPEIALVMNALTKG